MTSHESLKTTHERRGGIESPENSGAEHRERLRETLEKAAETSPERSTIESAARHEALEKAKTIEKEPLVGHERELSPAERRNGPITKSERDTSFSTTMNEVQSQMSSPGRTFSKLIHNPVIEKASEATGATIARPNALLSGAVFAFLLTLAIYLIAKNIGYPLSGFESIGAFILGWIIGLAYDFLKIMITGRK